MADVVLAGHRRLHAVVEDLDRHAAERGERLDVTAQQRLQVLMHDVAREDEARMAEHQAEQPDDPAGAGIVGEVDDEAGKVDLCLQARRRLEAHLVGLGAVLGADRGQIALHRRIGAAIAELADLAGQPRGAQIRKGGHALAQKIQVGRELARPPDRARTVSRRLDAALDIFADRLRISPRAPGDGGDRQTLSMQFQNHHQFSKSDHRASLQPGGNDGDGGANDFAGASPGKIIGR